MPPDPSGPDPQGKVSRWLPIRKRPASVWALVVLLTLSIGFITYFTFILYQDANNPTSYASSSEALAGLTFSWMGSLLEDGIKFLAIVIFIPLFLVVLVLLVAGLIGVLRGKKWSLILIGIFMSQLVAFSALMLYFSALMAGFIALIVAACFLVAMNLPETKQYSK